MKQNKALFAETFKRDLRWSALGVVIVLAICLGGALPKNDYTYYVSYTSNASRFAQELMNDTNATFSGISLMATLFLMIKNFSFMYSPKKADTFYSLPISRKALFLIRYFSGFVAILIPVILYYLLRVIVIFIEGKVTVTYALGGFLWTVIPMFTVSAFVILCMVLAGNFKNLFFTSFGFVFAELVIGYNIAEIANAFLQGMDYQRDMLLTVVMICPLSVIASRFSVFFGPLGLADFSIPLSAFVGVQLLVAFVTISLAIFLFTKREAEAYTKSFAFEKSYVFFTFAIALSGFVMGVSSSMTLAILLLMGSVGSIISALLFALIVNKKKLKIALLTSAATIVTAIAGILVCITGGFGWSSYVPEASAVESAKVKYGYKTILLEDASDLITMHGKIVDGLPIIKKRSDPYYEKTLPVNITYTLKSGREVHRKFVIYIEEYEQEFYNCYIGEGHVKAIENITSGPFKNATMNITGKKVELNKKKIELLKEAYLLDIKEMEKDDLEILNSAKWKRVIINYEDGKTKEFDIFIGNNVEKYLQKIS